MLAQKANVRTIRRLLELTEFKLGKRQSLILSCAKIKRFIYLAFSSNDKLNVPNDIQSNGYARYFTHTAEVCHTLHNFL